MKTGVSSDYYGHLISETLTDHRNYTFPNKSGTIALTSDIPSSTNFVTINTPQAINAHKTFNVSTSYNPGAIPIIYYDSSDQDNFVGRISFDDANTYNMSLQVGALTDERVITLPDKSGTVALTSDIPSVSYPVTDVEVNGSSVLSGTVAQITVPSLTGYATESWVTNQGYVTSASLATVATSGSYNDLSNKPTIPSSTDFVTVNTAQTITSANKEFRNSNIYLTGNNYGQSALYFNNSIRLKPDTTNNNLLLVQSSNTDITSDIYGVLFPDTQSYTANKTLATTDQIPSVPVTDVTVGGVSVVSSGTAVIPAIPSASDFITVDGTTDIDDGKVLSLEDGYYMYIGNDTAQQGQTDGTGIGIAVGTGNDDGDISITSSGDINIDANQSININVNNGSMSYNGSEIATINDIPTVPSYLPVETLTTEPTAAYTGGGMKVVYLSAEPTTKYAGYIYMIAES